MRICGLLAAIAAMTLAGCSDDDAPGNSGRLLEPAIVEESYLTVHEDDEVRSRRTYSYDSRGRVTAVIETGGAVSIACTYAYRNSEIDITLTRTDADGTYKYTETATVDNGRVARTEGILSQSAGNGNLVAETHYAMVYLYDNDRLASITHYQWNENRDKDNAWTWVNTLEWQGNVITKYVDANGYNSMPHYTYTYEYLDTPLARQSVVPLTDMPQHDALMLNGLFGKLPDRPMSARKRLGLMGESTTRRYIYDISADGLINRVVTTVNSGTMYEYTVEATLTYGLPTPQK